jgi:two-component system chemotaxis sensor kinase CheA
LDQSLNDFVAEAEDILDSLDESISQLMDISPDDHRKPDLINAIFRQAHSLKGLSGMFNLEGVSSLSHKLENLLDAMRLDKVQLSPSVIELLSTGSQLLSKMVRAIAGGQSDESVNTSDFLSDLENLGQDTVGTADQDLSVYIDVPEGMTEMLSEYEEHRFRDNITREIPFFRVKCAFPLETFDVELEEIGNTIKDMGELLTTLPDADMGGEGNIAFLLYFTSKEEPSTVEERLGGESRQVEAVEQKEIAAQDQSTVVDAVRVVDEADSLEDEIKGVSNTVRVDISKLDFLMNLVGELVILKSSYANVAQRLRDSGGGVVGELLLDLEKSNSQMEKKLVDLRDGVMDIRMVPMGQLFNRLQRVAKKLARELGKQIEVRFFGSETELDKMIMEEMVSPLLHIVRNSMDHGIEDAETRRALGKKETGNIKVSAFQQGNHVILEVEDDGKGIDVENIKASAVSRGDITGDEGLSDDEVLNLLFRPGFSTKDSVTEVSGRGVGMDVVRRELENIGGTVEIHTRPGEGTRITLTLPITLAILQALLVRSGERVFAIPMGSIQETIELSHDMIKTMQGREVITLRDKTISLIRLEKVFDLPDSGDSGTYAVIVGMANRTMGLVSEELLGKQDIVIKPLGEAFTKTVGLAGAAELGDQSTILVLDVAGLMMEAIRAGAVDRR